MLNGQSGKDTRFMAGRKRVFMTKTVWRPVAADCAVVLNRSINPKLLNSRLLSLYRVTVECFLPTVIVGNLVFNSQRYHDFVFLTVLVSIFSTSQQQSNICDLRLQGDAICLACLCNSEFPEIHEARPTSKHATFSTAIQHSVQK